MKYIKIAVIVLLITSLTSIGVFNNSTFQKAKSVFDVEQIIASDFKYSASAFIFPREHRTAGKSTAGPRIIHKSVLITSDCLSANFGIFSTGSFGFSNVTLNGTSKHTLFALHCLLTV